MKARDKQVGGNHYKNQSVEPWDVIDTWSLEQRIGYYRGNALKYVMRMGSKDESAQEVGKAIHYLEKLTETLTERLSAIGDEYVAKSEQYDVLHGYVSEDA